jgi:hypothetical protein
MLTSPEAPIVPGYSGYYTLPKDIGDVSVEELLRIAGDSALEADVLMNGAAVRYHAVAGSAYVEAALVRSLGSRDVDESLAFLDSAELHLRQSADGEYRFLETGFYDPDHQDDWLRAELQCDFMNVYRDIACGEVTLHTRDEIIAALRKKLAYAEGLATVSQGKGRGVAYELRVLLRLWTEYKQDGDMIAFPSTARGGSGEERHRETHDIILAHQQDEHWNYAGLEVKGGEGLTLASLARYLHPIVHVNHDGGMRTY